MRRVILVVLAAPLIAGCVTENVTNPGVTFSDLSFSSVTWDATNIPVSSHSEGFTYSPWDGRREYNSTDTVFQRESGAGSDVKGQDPHYTFKVDRNDLDSAKIDIDQQQKTLSLLFSYSTWHPSMSDKPSSDNGYLIRFIDLPYELNADSSITAFISGPAASTHIVFSSHSYQSTGGTSGYPQSSSSTKVLGPVSKDVADYEIMSIKVLLKK
jgi:hypothetical protein